MSTPAEKIKTGTRTHGANGKAPEACEPLPAGTTVEDFRAYLPAHQYIYTPTRELWPPSSVNAHCQRPTNLDGSPVIKQVRREGTTEFRDVPVPISEWLDKHRPVHQMTWAPGLPMVIKDRLVADGGWIHKRGADCFNLYRPPHEPDGDPQNVRPWLAHIRCIYPENVEHIVRWLAHRVQRPGEKINHALVLGGAQGTGKDTLIEPAKYAIGAWNFADVAPAQLLGRFNGFVKSVILRISEARDLGDVDRYSFYEHSKLYTAAPPDVIRCDEKNLREHAVMNVTGVIITTNHKTDGIYLPADDRRHYVAWTEMGRETFGEDYWRALWGWYAQGGLAHVAAYLAQLDLAGFDPKAPPPKTPAWHAIVDANRAPEDADVGDALDSLGKPAALTLTDLVIHAASDEFRAWLKDRHNSRAIPHRLEDAGYVAVRNDVAEDGLWRIDGRRQTIYAQRALPVRERLSAAARLVRRQ